MQLKQVSEATAFLSFLRAELDSPTERTRLLKTLRQLKLSEQVITGAYLEKPDSNITPWGVFKAYRGKEDVFEGLNFQEITWYQTALTEEDLRFRTLTCRNNFENKFGTRKPDEVARQLNVESPAAPNGVIERIQQGHVLEPPLLLTDPSLKRLVILEGHNRLLSYLREPSVVNFPIKVLVGLSPSISHWCQW
ncbi:MAG: hypothetical protein AAF512_14315 [Pseudomonadota bacterium]